MRAQFIERYIHVKLYRDPNVGKSDPLYDAVINAIEINNARVLKSAADVPASQYGEDGPYLGKRTIAGHEYAVTDADRALFDQLEYLKTFQASEVAPTEGN